MKKCSVSVIVCTRNVATLLQQSLASIAMNKPQEIIVVDGCSTDDTIAVAKQWADTILSDEGKGLSYARHIGVNAAKGDEILFVGPDNVLPHNFITSLYEKKQEWGFDVACVQTRVLKPVTIWDKGADFRWQALMGTPGPVTVPGTPAMYSRYAFSRVQFSKKDHGPSDDTDMAEQLMSNNYIVGIVPLWVWEANGSTRKDVWKRYFWYGTGDYYFYEDNKTSWTTMRKMKSLTHPLRQCIVHMLQAIKRGRILAILFLCFAMGARYCGWIYQAGQNQKNTKGSKQ